MGPWCSCGAFFLTHETPWITSTNTDGYGYNMHPVSPVPEVHFMHVGGKYNSPHIRLWRLTKETYAKYAGSNSSINR